jgi:prolyl 4-hydroxylase
MNDILKRADALAGSGRVVEAAELLERASAAGEGVAAFTLANWRLTGAIIRRDLRLARDYFLRSAELGIAEAEPIAIALLANGAGGSGREWHKAISRLSDAVSPSAIRQLQLLSGMSLDEQGEPAGEPASERLSEDPEIRRYAEFLTPSECAYLSELALPRLQPAVVVHPTTGAFLRDTVRTSTSVGFPFVAEDPVLHAINRRIAKATGTSYEQGEPLQVLSYEPGQEYKLHSDALPGQGNQRIVTFLVYLNDEYAGGQTSFPDLGISFRGSVGEGLMFRNVDSRGQPQPRARHAGLPVSSGRKLILSKWIRSEPLDLSGPPGRPL